MTFNINLISSNYWSIASMRIKFSSLINCYGSRLYANLITLHLCFSFLFPLLAAGYQYDSNLAVSLPKITSSGFSTFLYKLQVGCILVEEVNWYKNMHKMALQINKGPSAHELFFILLLLLLLLFQNIP